MYVRCSCAAITIPGLLWNYARLMFWYVYGTPMVCLVPVNCTFNRFYDETLLVRGWSGCDWCRWYDFKIDNKMGNRISFISVDGYVDDEEEWLSLQSIIKGYINANFRRLISTYSHNDAPSCCNNMLFTLTHTFSLSLCETSCIPH